jgi:hypothetical protein
LSGRLFHAVLQLQVSKQTFLLALLEHAEDFYSEPLSPPTPFLHPLSELKRALNLRQLRTDMAGADVTGTSLVAGAAVEN